MLNPGLNGSWGHSAKGQRGHSLKSTKFLLNVAAAFVSQIVTVSMESSLFNFFFFETRSFCPEGQEFLNDISRKKITERFL